MINKAEVVRFQYKGYTIDGLVTPANDYAIRLKDAMNFIFPTVKKPSLEHFRFIRREAINALGTVEIEGQQGSKMIITIAAMIYLMCQDVNHEEETKTIIKAFKLAHQKQQLERCLEI